jgi:rSAM/selenodomain-associated transferase 1
MLFFVKSPAHAPVKSRLSESIGMEAARDLYRNFVGDMLETLAGVAAKTGHALFVCVHPPEAEALRQMQYWLGDDYRYWPQEGKDLGERMKNAFLASFAAGYKKTLLIGSDAPDLTGEIVAEGWERLEREGAVIGPARDGGYYLIGFQSDAFLPVVFEDIPWSTGEVLSATLQAFRAAGSDVSLLPPWQDIDTFADLQDFRARHEKDYFADSRTMRCLRSRQEKAS